VLTVKDALLEGRPRRNRDASNSQLQSRAGGRTSSQAAGSSVNGADVNNPSGGPYSEDVLSAIK